ncbi:MAG: LPXTG cell wall anchor domain-containing protein [Fibrobacter sp.]|jgi:LPXTG-motif cell wall-anchored protein|nr:LPXTG cell wall anchor domain-containing protein [Fibrobacter sp.]
MITKSILFFVLAFLAFTFAVPAPGTADTGLAAISVQEISADSIPAAEPQTAAKETFAPAGTSENSPSFIGILMLALLFGFLFSFLRRRR